MSKKKMLSFKAKMHWPLRNLGDNQATYIGYMLVIDCTMYLDTPLLKYDLRLFDGVDYLFCGS